MEIKTKCSTPRLLMKTVKDASSSVPDDTNASAVVGVCCGAQPLSLGACAAAAADAGRTAVSLSQLGFISTMQFSE